MLDTIIIDILIGIISEIEGHALLIEKQKIDG